MGTRTDKLKKRKKLTQSQIRRINKIKQNSQHEK